MTDADWVQQERDHEYRMASLKEDVNRRRREHLTERISTITVGTVVVLGIAIAAGLIYFWQASAGERGREVELACVQNGGTWTGVGGGADVCIRATTP
jgi:hypothetical protein